MNRTDSAAERKRKHNQVEIRRRERMNYKACRCILPACCCSSFVSLVQFFLFPFLFPDPSTSCCISHCKTRSGRLFLLLLFCSCAPFRFAVFSLHSLSLFSLYRNQFFMQPFKKFFDCESLFLNTCDCRQSILLSSWSTSKGFLHSLLLCSLAMPWAHENILWQRNEALTSSGRVGCFFFCYSSSLCVSSPSSFFCPRTPIGLLSLSY